MLNKSSLDWINNQDPQFKIILVLCITALLVLLIVVYATNPIAGAGLTSLFLLLKSFFKRDDKDDTDDRSGKNQGKQQKHRLEGYKIPSSTDV